MLGHGGRLCAVLSLISGAVACGAGNDSADIASSTEQELVTEQPATVAVSKAQRDAAAPAPRRVTAAEVKQMQQGLLAQQSASAVSGAGPSLAAAAARVPGGTCTVNFSNSAALGFVLGQARSTFASITGVNAAGKLVPCAQATGNQAAGTCWTYRQTCVSRLGYVDDVTGIGHFHLGFTAPGFEPICNFFDPGDGYGSGYGKKVGSSCVQPNWAAEPRVFGSHVPNQWIQIQMRQPGSLNNIIFDLKRIRVGNGAKIQFWFLSAATNSWFAWDHLTANTNWTLAASHDVKQVQISGETGASTSFQLIDFDLTE